MIPPKHAIVLLWLILGSSARSLYHPYHDEWDHPGSALMHVPKPWGFNPMYSSFASELYTHLLGMGPFQMVFNGFVSPDMAANMATMVGHAFAREFHIDPHFTSTAFLNSVTNMFAGGGDPSAYALGLANAAAQSLSRFGIVNAYNTHSLVDAAAGVIAGSITMALGTENKLEEYDMYDIDDDIGINTRGGAGGGAGGKGGGLLGLGLGLNGGLGLNAGLGLNGGLGLNAGLGLNGGLGLGLGLGLGAGLGVNADVNAGLGLNADVGLGVNADVGLGVNADVGLGLNADVNAGLGLNADVNADVGLGLGLGLGADVGLGLGLGADVGLGLGLGADVGLGLGLGLGANAGLGLGVNLGGGGKGKGKGGKELLEVFKARLVGELIKDKYFRIVFSDSIPAAAVSSLASAIAQFLSKAFNLKRSLLLTFENDLAILIKSELNTPEAYAEGIAISLGSILAAAKILTPAAMGVQVAMVSKAITSAILNYVGTSKVTGVGLGVSNNPYNSYFSILSGLEMLPYVGPDAVSRKYPPILKAAKASAFGTKFTKALYSNLVSSSKFSDAFVLGVPTPAWKSIAKCLGNSMAEAFGSPNPSFFVDSYANALLSIGEKLSHKTYARVLSAATAKALYALGYFVSGNPNIQAAIASNAIVKAIANKSKKEFPALSTNLGLPWMTAIAGVPPPSKGKGKKGGKGGGLNVGVDVGAGLGVGLDLGIGADLGLDLNADLDLDLNADLNLDANVNAAANVFGRRKKRDLLDVNAALDIGANVGAAVNAGLDIDANVGLGLDADIGLGLGLGANVGLGLGANVGLGGKGKGGSGKDKGGQQGQLSIADVLPLMLSEKLFSSTAMFTAMTIVGSRKVANLIAQGMAAQFGFEAASAFANTYDASLANIPDNNYGPCMAGIAKATTSALISAGILRTPFTVLSVDQLSTAIVAKYSSLIATSLDAKDWNVGAKWSYIFNQDFTDPPMTRGYVRPSVFGSYLKSLDESVAFDYNMNNMAGFHDNGLYSPRSKILMKK